MRRSLLAITIAATTLLSACSGAAGPGWTYAAPTVPPPATPAASVDPSAAAPSTAPGEPTPVPGASGAAGAAITEGALNVAFTNASLTAPAGAPFAIEFDNQDAGIPHNILIKGTDGGTLFDGDLVNGPAKATYNVPALAAGMYTFVCKVHPNMTGTIMVGG